MERTSGTAEPMDMTICALPEGIPEGCAWVAEDPISRCSMCYRGVYCALDWCRDTCGSPTTEL